MKGHSKLRSTKIVCTIGPATSAADQIRQLILAGMDVARLNFSHGDHDSHRETLHLLNEPMSELLPMTPSSISRAACQMAEDLGAAAIVAGTSSGSTARLVARFRPARPIVGLTPRVLTQRQLTLSWGVFPALVSPFWDTEEMFSLSGSWLLDQGLARQGDRVIVTAGVPVGVPGTTNIVRVIEIK
jgi:pyruvate kinase